ncbi:hypothetical protein IID24_04545 [Patescibacteria group bacterium]|nr:hypothetical protein [Patescibacteria group bacterium]
MKRIVLHIVLLLGVPGIAFADSPVLPLWAYLIQDVIGWLTSILLIVVVFEIGNITFRKIKRKPIKKHLKILFIASIVFILLIGLRWILTILPVFQETSFSNIPNRF